ncbi:MAG: hypothetical protein IJ685_12365 [Selenomonadaceae bacterium]|nr:hypothetical protein [Selenomonadaceae bacterium]
MFSDERVTETTRIISEDEVPPEILAEIRRKELQHANTVTKIINASSGATGNVNVGALMSAARPKVDKSSDAKLEQRSATLAEKLVNIAKAGEEQRDERIRAKSKNFLDAFHKGQQRDK